MINRINCICHLLNNVVGHICGVDPVKIIIENASVLVSFIKNSGLGEKCNPKLQKHFEVRWNTVYYTLNSVALNYTQLAQILLEKENADKNADVMHKLTIISRTDLEIISAFLKKFKVWTDLLEADKTPTLWMVWPTLVSLKKYLADNDEDSNIITKMKEAGRRYLELNSLDFTPKSVHKISTVLHPLLKNIALATEDERNDVYGMIDDFVWKSEPFHETMESNLNEKPKHYESEDVFEEFIGNANVETSQSDKTKELQNYLLINMPSSNPYEFDLCGWWHENRLTFPKLYHLFLSKAGITASSAPSERKFSETGIILQARRSNLLPETVSNMVLARNKLMNFI